MMRTSIATIAPAASALAAAPALRIFLLTVSLSLHSTPLQNALEKYELFPGKKKINKKMGGCRFPKTHEHAAGRDQVGVGADVVWRA